MNITATALKDLNLIDNIIEEPLGGAHRDYALMAANLKHRLMLDLNQLKLQSTDQLLDRRYQRLLNYSYLSNV